MAIRSKEAGGQGHADADVVFALSRRRRDDQHQRAITGTAASMGEGVVSGVLDALIKDFAGKLARSDVEARVDGDHHDATRSARAKCRSTAAPRSRRTPTGRSSTATARTTTSASTCGNVLATAMHPVQMTKKVRVRCGRCSTVNVSVIDGYEAASSGAPKRQE